MTNELLKAQIEAALFLTDKPLKAAAVARIVNADVNVVRQMIIELIHDYESRSGGLEVADDDGYIIQVKDEYTHFVDEFVPIDMPTALIRTLSAIAIKQPVLQSEIIKIRGAGAYDHIKELLARELINKREEGRSSMLTTTKKFQEYFRLSKDGKTFRQQFGKEPTIPSGEQSGAGAGDAADIAAVAGVGANAGTGEASGLTAEVVTASDTMVPAAPVSAPDTSEPEGPIQTSIEFPDPLDDEEEEIAVSPTEIASEIAADAIEGVAAASNTIIEDAVEDSSTFDASPDPDTPPIGIAAEQADELSGHGDELAEQHDEPLREQKSATAEDMSSLEDDAEDAPIERPVVKRADTVDSDRSIDSL